LPEVTDPAVKALLDKSADSAQLVSRDLKINVDDASGKYVISVLDPETEEVIRQFPPEGALNMLETISRIIDEDKGSLINEQT
jgi:flagellar protein FlaG